ncbi:hypothetical protein AGMMS50230_16880 [Spirochaetia bacterium]|nr:hypothetical protein AGMMS50230_16880 [Spirochaetia bacterium]
MEFFKLLRHLAYLTALVFFAFFELASSDLVRRTFEFAVFNTGKPVVEDRMLYSADSPELNIKSYVEESILGPVSVDLAPLLTRGTKLRSFMFRDKTVYADFSGEAVIPVPGGLPLFDSFVILNRGIRRNFRYVRDVKLFVNGNEVFFTEFSKIFGAE